MARGFDDLLSMVGRFGRYQKMLTFFVLLPAVLPSGFLSMSSIFFAATPFNYHCARPANETEVDANIWTPHREHEHRCHDFHWDNNHSTITNISDCQHGYEYDRTIFQQTVITEFDLVCDRHFEGTFTFTIFSLGGLFGPLIWGYLADRFGRKTGFFLCVIFQSIFAVLTAWTPGYVWFCICRFLVGMTTSASYTIPLTLNLEISGPKHRAFLSVLHSFAYSSGCLIFLAVAYFIRSWRILACATAIPAAILYIVIWKCFPESPRWLLNKGHDRQFEELMRKIAKINRVKFSEETQSLLLEIMQKDESVPMVTKKNTTPWDLLKTPNMRRKTLILVFLNICNKGVSLGLNYYSPLFSTNPHLGAFLNTLVELPPYLFAKTVLNFFGRRTSLFFGFLTGGITCVTAFTVPNHIPGIVLTLSLIAKFSVTFTYLGAKLMEDELFPTGVRSEGHSLVSVLSSITTCGVPFIVDLGHNFAVLPLLIFGSACIVATFAVFFLPETVYQSLPQTLEDGENFGNDVPLREKFRFIPKPIATTNKNLASRDGAAEEETKALTVGS